MCKPYLHYQASMRANSNLNQSLQTNEKFQRFSSQLFSFGFNNGQINRILQSPESVMSFNEDEILYNLANWLAFDVNEKLFTVLSTYPELLTLNPDFVNFRTKELMSLFTRKDISKLLVTCPCVFVDDFSHIYDKVEYIVYMMGVEQKSIVKSRALQFDLHHIKCRHIFMARAGRYIISKRAVRNKNAPLDKIFSRNIETFLKLTHLSEEEYTAFCQMYKEELLEQEDSDDELNMKEKSDDL